MLLLNVWYILVYVNQNVVQKYLHWRYSTIKLGRACIIGAVFQIDVSQKQKTVYDGMSCEYTVAISLWSLSTFPFPADMAVETY